MPSRPARIAIDASCAMESPLTGVGYAALYLVRALCRLDHGFDLRLFATPDRQSVHALDELRPCFTSWSTPINARQLKYFLWPAVNFPPIEWFCGEIDIAHNLFHQLPAARKARRVVTIHDLSFLRMPEVHTRRNVEKQTRLVRHCARYADAIVTVSDHCRGELIDFLGVAPDKVSVVKNAVDHSEFEEPLDTERLAAVKERLGLRQDYFIHLGTLEPRKNIPTLLRAYNRLRRQESNCPQLLLVGKRGWLSEPIFETMDTLCLHGDVVHAGHLSRAEAVLLLRGALASVYVSFYEGFGLPVLEAMAARTPVVCSNIGPLREVAGDTALFVEPEDEAGVAAALESVLSEPAQAQARVEAAWARARTFTWTSSAEALARVYRGLV